MVSAIQRLAATHATVSLEPPSPHEDSHELEPFLSATRSAAHHRRCRSRSLLQRQVVYGDQCCRRYDAPGGGDHSGDDPCADGCRSQPRGSRTASRVGGHLVPSPTTRRRVRRSRHRRGRRRPRRAAERDQHRHASRTDVGRRGQYRSRRRSERVVRPRRIQRGSSRRCPNWPDSTRWRAAPRPPCPA